MAKDPPLVPAELKNSTSSFESIDPRFIAAHDNVALKVRELETSQRQLSEEVRTKLKKLAYQQDTKYEELQQLIKNQNETFKALVEEKLGALSSRYGRSAMQGDDVKKNMGQQVRILEPSFQAVTTSEIENGIFRLEREAELKALKARLQALEDAVKQADFERLIEAAKKVQAELTWLKTQVQSKQVAQYPEFNETERTFVSKDDMEKVHLGHSLERVEGGWDDDGHQSKKASEQPVAGSALAAARVTRSSSTTALEKAGGGWDDEKHNSQKVSEQQPVAGAALIATHATRSPLEAARKMRTSSTTALAAAHRYRYKYMPKNALLH
eukprot:gnl/MRDRNA2_/MRDRNA2_122251_c0_seq1.p1 gnl/MRDRNA2_/MRDRNA2_122251_c0~~gnl/MRDRNA2_/MRDRNA2_122251_c0_seq1.p1  ORF type:complete len:326 (-),score=79.34 gnl/MRDRNA2_/MRDRNA2_122251_c0_seq1:849-1826(-)